MKTELEQAPYQSREFLEKSRILELEKEVIELRHKYNIEELMLERQFHKQEHIERMGEIRLKNANVIRSIEEKDKKIRESYERKQQRFQEFHGKSAQPQEEKGESRQDPQVHSGQP